MITTKTNQTKETNKNQLGEGNVSFSVYRLLAIMEGSQGSNMEARTEPEVMKEHCMLAWCGWFSLFFKNKLFLRL